MALILIGESEEVNVAVQLNLSVVNAEREGGEREGGGEGEEREEIGRAHV